MRMGEVFIEVDSFPLYMCKSKCEDICLEGSVLDRQYIVYIALASNACIPLICRVRTYIVTYVLIVLRIYYLINYVCGIIFPHPFITFFLSPSFSDWVTVALPHRFNALPSRWVHDSWLSTVYSDPSSWEWCCCDCFWGCARFFSQPIRRIRLKIFWGTMTDPFLILAWTKTTGTSDGRPVGWKKKKR